MPSGLNSFLVFCGCVKEQQPYSEACDGQHDHFTEVTQHDNICLL